LAINIGSCDHQRALKRPPFFDLLTLIAEDLPSLCTFRTRSTDRWPYPPIQAPWLAGA
jgi:hypothetical protein